jgi:hypothetical protein
MRKIGVVTLGFAREIEPPGSRPKGCIHDLWFDFFQFNVFNLNLLYLDGLAIDKRLIVQMPVDIENKNHAQDPERHWFLLGTWAAQDAAKMYPPFSGFLIGLFLGLVIPRPVMKFPRLIQFEKEAHFVLLLPARPDSPRAHRQPLGVF